MGSQTDSSPRVWFERTVIAVMVIVGFAVGSLGLTVVAEFRGDDPVLTDEFNAPVADDEPVLVSLETVTTTPPATTPPTTTAPPADATEPAEADADDDRDRGRRPRGDGERADRRRR